MRSITDTFIKHPVLAVVVRARLRQVRSELTAEAEPPVGGVQRADRPYASFYLGCTSSERDIPALTAWLSRNMQPQLSTLAGVQRVDVVGGRPIAMRIWIDPDRLAALNLAPGDVHAALQRNNYLAAVGQTKGDLVQVNLLANTDLRTPRSSRTSSWRSGTGRSYGSPTWPKWSWAPRRRTSSPSSATRRPCTSASGRSSGATRSKWPTGSTPRWPGSGPRCRRTSTCSSRTTRPCS